MHGLRLPVAGLELRVCRLDGNRDPQDFVDDGSLLDGFPHAFQIVDAATGKVPAWAKAFYGSPMSAVSHACAHANGMAAYRDGVPEIARIATVSSGHVTKETAGLLDAQAEGVENPLSIGVYAKGGYGWFVYAGPGNDIGCLPRDLARVVEFARGQGCGIVCLDQDGPEIDGLPMYDW